MSGTLRLLELPHLADTAALCTSELVTNVHVHARGPVHVRFTAEEDRVRVGVHDGSGRLPVARKASVRETGGRGLGIVEALADGCGVTDVRRGVLTKGVWFELDAKGAPAL